MFSRLSPVFILGLLATACGTPAPPQDEATPAAAEMPAAAVDMQMACTPSPRMAVEGRQSPFDSTAFQVGSVNVLVCYGRPAARGRTMIGGDAVPHGRLWRTGANEPTIMHLSGPLNIAGIDVPAGSYSLYTIPGESEWTVIVNRSTSQWGHESSYTAEVEAQEVGRGTAPVTRPEEHVESFTIRPQPAAAGQVDLLLEWEHTRVTIPVRAR
jgi:hypothetical protein